MRSSRASSTWASVLRSGLRLSLAQRGTSSGWRVSEFRGRTRLTVDGRTGRHQALLPIEWSHEQADAIRDTVLAVHDAYLAGSCLDQAIAAALASDEQTGESGVGPVDWPALVEQFKARKLSSGAIKPQTWSSVYQRRMAELLAVFEGSGRRPTPGAPGSRHGALGQATRSPWPADAGAADRSAAALGGR